MVNQQINYPFEFSLSLELLWLANLFISHIYVQRSPVHSVIQKVPILDQL